MAVPRRLAAAALGLALGGRALFQDDAAALLQSASGPSNVGESGHVMLTEAEAERASVTLAGAFADLMASGLAQVQGEAEVQAETAGLTPSFDKKRRARGFRFSRNTTEVEEGSSLLLSMTGPEGGAACEAEDAFGGRRCRLPWGSKVRVKYAVKLGKPLDAGSTITLDIPRPQATGMASLLARRVEPAHLSCPACTPTKSCSVTYMGRNLTVKMPPCPIPAGEKTFIDKELVLPNFPILNTVDGSVVTSVHLKREDGSSVARITTKMWMGPLDRA